MGYQTIHHHGQRATLGELAGLGYLPDGLDFAGALTFVNIPDLVDAGARSGRLPRDVMDAPGVSALPLMRTRQRPSEGPSWSSWSSTEEAASDEATVAALGVDLLRVPAGASFPPHTHPGHHLLYCVKGRGSFTYAGRILTVEPGDLMLALANVPHAVGAPFGDDHYLLSFGAPHRHVSAADRMTVIDGG